MQCLSASNWKQVSRNCILHTAEQSAIDKGSYYALKVFWCFGLKRSKFGSVRRGAVMGRGFRWSCFLHNTWVVLQCRMIVLSGHEVCRNVFVLSSSLQEFVSGFQPYTLRADRIFLKRFRSSIVQTLFGRSFVDAGIAFSRWRPC